jgi:hypothetical protein
MPLSSSRRNEIVVETIRLAAVHAIGDEVSPRPSAHDDDTAALEAIGAALKKRRTGAIAREDATDGEHRAFTRAHVLRAALCSALP